MERDEAMRRFAEGADKAVKEGCGGRELLQIAGGPWVPCPGCKDCLTLPTEAEDES